MLEEFLSINGLVIMHPYLIEDFFTLKQLANLAITKLK